MGMKSVVLLILFSLFNVCFADVWLMDQHDMNLGNFYQIRKDGSRPGHSGFFLTLTEWHKYEICESIMKPKYWPIYEAEDVTQALIPLYVGIFRIRDHTPEPAISFVCRGLKDDWSSIEYSVIYGFTPNTYFVGEESGLLKAFVQGTPTFVLQAIPDLEAFYYRIRRQIGILGYNGVMIARGQ